MRSRWPVALGAVPGSSLVLALAPGAGALRSWVLGGRGARPGSAVGGPGFGLPDSGSGAGGSGWARPAGVTGASQSPRHIPPPRPLAQRGSPAGDRALSPLLSGAMPQFPLFGAGAGRFGGVNCHSPGAGGGRVRSQGLWPVIKVAASSLTDPGAGGPQQLCGQARPCGWGQAWMGLCWDPRGSGVLGGSWAACRIPGAGEGGAWHCSLCSPSLCLVMAGPLGPGVPEGAGDRLGNGSQKAGTRPWSHS